jgi:hypothetical protein
MNSRALAILLAFILGTSLLFTSCGKLFGSKIPEEKFVSYYIDLLAAQDSLGKDPATTGKILTTLNKKYDVSAEQYDRTIKFYSDNPDEWERFFSRAITVAQQRKTGH